MRTGLMFSAGLDEAFELYFHAGFPNFSSYRKMIR